MVKRVIGVLLLAGVVGVSALAQSQTPAQAPPQTFEAVTARTWKALHNKILVMAKDTQFPDDKL
ncbi:MAG: hypothetical protein IT185_06115, partial [Acidobacteria bacterium]|nr:hypothetical protein [Acidobacteriota bacterium]